MFVVLFVSARTKKFNEKHYITICAFDKKKNQNPVPLEQ